MKSAKEKLDRLFKKGILFSGLAIGIGLSGDVAAQDKKSDVSSNSQPRVRMNNSLDSLSYAIGVSIATHFKSQGVKEISYAFLNKAVQDVLIGQELLMDEIQANMTIQEKLNAYKNQKLEMQKKESAEFLEQNKKREGVVTLPSGLQYEVIRKGDGTIHPTDSSRVRAHYTGKLINGKKFDSSLDRGKPLEFGVGQVIKGWTEAIKLMTKGDKWILYIPPALGYGDRGAGGDIPGGAALIFEVELLDIL
ncbi:MAG TPA: FKBP-type peptidyl-prolyl cis-trans isomerase [Parasegetibacter sp.]